jgi:ketosteroid isomerase-like protein
MSQENVEVIRHSTELWLRGDFEGWLETIDLGVEWDISTHPLPDVPNRGRGREALVSDMLATYVSGWNDYSATIKEVSEAGDQVILVLHETATMRDTGVPLERDLVQLWSVRDGRGAFLRVFRTKQEALEAAGQSITVMSSDAETVRRAIDALNQGIETGQIRPMIEKYFDPEFEYLPPPGVPEPGPYRGHDEFEAFLRFFTSQFDQVQITLEDVNEAGGKVTYRQSTQVKGGGSGALVADSSFCVATVRNNRLLRVVEDYERAGAMRRAGRDS